MSGPQPPAPAKLPLGTPDFWNPNRAGLALGLMPTFLGMGGMLITLLFWLSAVSPATLSPQIGRAPPIEVTPNDALLISVATMVSTVLTAVGLGFVFLSALLPAELVRRRADAEADPANAGVGKN